MRIVIDARIHTGDSGGIESVVIGLAHGLASLTDADDTYLFHCLPGAEGFLDPFLGPNSSVIYPNPSRTGLVDRATRKMARTVTRKRSYAAPSPNLPPTSDGTVEKAGADLVHFTSQAAFQTGLPTIYHPHDLQHLHLPELFPAEVIAWREGWYRTLCEQASMVAVASAWVKQDVERSYQLDPDKVQVVPMAPPTSAYREMDDSEAAAIRAGMGVPALYILYPAQTWEHKNHVGLLKAMAEMRDRFAVSVNLVAPGRQNEHYAEIRHVQTALGLDGHVVWPGFVSPDDLQALYQGARAVVIPSRFEAASFPLWEAFRAGVAAACSNVTSLPEQAGDAALVFDPYDTEAIASAVHRLWADKGLRATLIGRGRDRVQSLGWDSTARIFRAHYRRLTHREMSEMDVSLTRPYALL